MPHLAPMSWLLAIIMFWIIMLLFTSNIWWSNLHMFETDTSTINMKTSQQWFWSLQDGWEQTMNCKFMYGPALLYVFCMLSTFTFQVKSL